MKIEAQTSTIKIWFGLLKLALVEGLPINQEFYASWGTRDQLLQLRFNTWWRLTGEKLFAKTMPKVSVLDQTEEYVSIRVPNTLTSSEAKRQVGKLLTGVRGSKRDSASQHLSFDGDIKYRTLKQYERLLEIEFDPRNAGKTIEQKAEMLRNVYRRIRERLDKQRATLQKTRKRGKAGALLSSKFRSRDPDGFGSAAEIRKGIDAKKVSRWRLSGHHLLLNVAEGQFPGSGYYGSKLAEKLAERLEAIGVDAIGSGDRSKGGGRRKQDLSLVRVRNSKQTMIARSLRAYGKGKNTNPVGGS